MIEIIKTPNNWNFYRLDEVFQIARGGSPRPIIDYITEGEGYNWIKIGDTKNVDKYIYSTKQKILKEGLKKSLLVKEDDFILSNSMSFGKPYIMKTEGCIHDGWLLLRKLKEDISVDFMYYVLSSDFIKTQFISKAAGSTVQNLNIKLVETVKALIPPLPEQQKIAEILSTVDAKIEVIDQQITETQALKKGLMQQLLLGKFSVTEKRTLSSAEMKDSALGEIPKSWEVVKLEKYSKKITDGSHYSPIPHAGTGFFIATVKDMKENKFSLDKCANISEEDFISLERNGCKPHVNDVLFSKDGTIGKTFVYKENQGVVLLSSVAIIRLVEERLNPFFVCQILKSDVFYNQLKGLTSGSAIRRLVLKAIKEIKIPVPPLKEQKNISEILSSVDEKLEVLSEKKTHYQELKQGLMQQLLTGKLRVPQFPGDIETLA